MQTDTDVDFGRSEEDYESDEHFICKDKITHHHHHVKKRGGGVRRVACSLILKVNLVRPSLPRSC
jgi:hypothetical protein